MGCSTAAQVKTLSPRVKTALRLYVSGAVRTQGEAARLSGMDKHYLSQLKVQNPVAQAYIAKLEAEIESGAVNMNAAIQQLARKGLMTIAKMMESDLVKDELRLKAAMDLADRSPETSKTNKLSIEADLSIRHEDANRLIAALVESSVAEATYAPLVSEGDYVKVDDGSQPLVLPPAHDG